MKFTDAQLTKLMDGMMASGMPRIQAVAVACALEYAVESHQFAEQYGTLLVVGVKAFIETATA